MLGGRELDPVVSGGNKFLQVNFWIIRFFVYVFLMEKKEQTIKQNNETKTGEKDQSNLKMRNT